MTEWQYRAEQVAAAFGRATSASDADVRAQLAALRDVVTETVVALARMEQAYVSNGRALGDHVVVLHYVAQQRVGLSVTADRGTCLIEQDGTVIHCASTIEALAAWCRAQDTAEQGA
jgi:hypothetical protein